MKIKKIIFKYIKDLGQIEWNPKKNREDNKLKGNVMMWFTVLFKKL